MLSDLLISLCFVCLTITNLDLGTAGFYLRYPPHSFSPNRPLCTSTPHPPGRHLLHLPLETGRTTKGFYFLWPSGLKSSENKLKFLRERMAHNVTDIR